MGTARQGEPLAKSSARRMAPSMAVRHRSLSGWPSGRRLRDSTRRAQRAARATIARSGSFFRSSVEIFGTIMFTSLGWGVCIGQDRVAAPVGLVPTVPHGLALCPPPYPRAVGIDLQHRVVLAQGIRWIRSGGWA